ncbi:DUF2849 domain-containing protein [Sphingorhabdus sp. Alg239-R122]|uniref:DUF2849 domain-containing protein n=1 Tax=Sphingorhabdus sp. Alg239-R122 TaxID=2305989 RepID=UPI0013DB5B03|nr:DUF2849 domain-containing protein [Sphingorhabdus sp. Alg239-R122]
MNLLTGNDLKTGDVIWWAGDKGWSLHVADAADAGDEGEAILAREEAARRVNASYIVAAEATGKGPMPLHIKERVRASGPTVRTDLAINTDIPIVNA